MPRTASPVTIRTRNLGQTGANDMPEPSRIPAASHNGAVFPFGRNDDQNKQGYLCLPLPRSLNLGHPSDYELDVAPTYTRITTVTFDRGPGSLKGRTSHLARAGYTPKARGRTPTSPTTRSLP
jgi:hypothetical protein